MANGLNARNEAIVNALVLLILIHGDKIEACERRVLPLVLRENAKWSATLPSLVAPIFIAASLSAVLFRVTRLLFSSSLILPLHLAIEPLGTL